jgi:nucleoside-diphosphate-sugar epimerase
MNRRGNPSVLVTGGCGFIGSAVVRRLQDQGWVVAVLDDLSTGFAENLPSRTIANLQKGSIVSRRDVRQALRGNDYVVHLAARAFVPDSFSRPEEFEQVNVYGSRVLLEECALAGVKRVVVASSAEVYGNSRTEVIGETAHTAPVSPYGETKLAMEKVALEIDGTRNTSISLLRLFNAYGQRATNPYVIPEIIRQGVKGTVVTLGDPKPMRDFCAVGDTARGIEAALLQTVAGGEVVNLGTGRAVSVSHLVKVVARKLGHEIEIEIDPSRLRPTDIRVLRADGRKALRDLDWAPTIPLEEGLRRTVDQYRLAGGWPYDPDVQRHAREPATRLPSRQVIRA